MLRLRDIMTTDVLTLSPDVTLRDAIELLAGSHVSGAPVVAGDKVLGVVTATDLLSFAASTPGVPADRPEQTSWEELEGPTEWAEGEEAPAAFFEELWEDVGVDVDERFREERSAEWDLFADHTVAEAMSRTVISLPSGALVEQAADVMRRAGIHRVLVMDDGRLTGLVTMKDVSDAVAEHKLTTRTYVFGAESKFDDRRFE